MKETLRKSQTATLLSLRPGDHVEVCNAGGQRTSGIVEMIHHDNGVFWIHNPLGERKLLDTHEHTIIWVLAEGQTGR